MRTIHRIVMGLSLVSMFLLNNSGAQAAEQLRRPISNEQPVWLVHIDTWNLADPQKIIDLIPEDIKPYVVFNLSLSINHREDKWLQVEYGYETAKSWLRTCAENQVWAMIQPSSGAFCHFPDNDMTIYEEFFRDYPNFLGFNYCEQFWGFGDPYGVTFEERMDHFENLMKLNVKYGGYLCWSWCNAFYDADRNFIAMMKRDEGLREICKAHPENIIVCEKFTMNHGFYENESTTLGAYLSGYAGHYGIRFDQTGWRGSTFREKYPVSAGPAPVLEHILLTGETVFDGPELIMEQCFQEVEPVVTDGYSSRKWEMFPQFENIYIDIFRKIADGTVRLLTREEVIDRTKLALVQDINVVSEDRDELRHNYNTPETFYDGLYKIPGDGTYLQQNSWFKSTGRYSAVPMVYGFADEIAERIPVKVNVSDYEKRWSTEESKVKEFNSLYPEEYSGDMYVGRENNCWVAYNPFKTGQMAYASIPLKYNTCEKIDLGFTQYSTVLIKEYKNSISLYLSNYDDKREARTDTVSIYGFKGKPSYKLIDRLQKRRSEDVAASVVEKLEGKTYSLYITHNGPLDIELSCKGKAKNRLSDYKTFSLVKPSAAPVYYGPRQYEAENFDYKSIESNVTNGVKLDVRNYTAQGYLVFGGNAEASVKDNVRALQSGKHRLELKYSAPEGERRLVMSVNGAKKALALPKTDEWGVVAVDVDLTKGDNTISFSADGASDKALILDNIVVSTK